MERYAPKLMELAPRDMVSRAIYQEIRAGRGIDGKDYVYLDVRHLGRKVIDEKLPDITDFVRVYQGIEPITEPIPIQPTAHYAMGGVPTDLLTQVDARRSQHRGARACTPPARWPACPSTAPTGWAPTRWWTCWSSAGGPAARWRSDLQGVGDARGRRAVIEPVRAEIEAIRGRDGRRAGRGDPRGAGRRDDGQRRRLPGRDGADRAPGTASRP